MEDPNSIINDFKLNDKKSFNLIYCYTCKSIPEIKLEKIGK